MILRTRLLALIGAVAAVWAAVPPGFGQSPVVRYHNYATAGVVKPAVNTADDDDPLRRPRWTWSAPVGWAGDTPSLTLPAVSPAGPTSARAPAPSFAPSPPPLPPPTVRAVRPQYHAFGGLDMNVYLGASEFYAAGFTGSRSIMANIEGEHLWNGHETLGHVSVFVNGPGALGVIGNHPTGVAFIMGGRPTTPTNEVQRGLAYGATLWSGALATTVNYDATFASLFQPYVTVFRTGINGQTADVSNSSYGDVGDSAGRAFEVRALDALVKDTGKVLVFAAGNSGPGPNTVLFPATAYNVISVAALDDHDGTPPFNVVAGFSSRGPSDVFIPTGTANGTTGNTITSGRTRVDIAAPGTELFVAATGSPSSYGGGFGTSYAAPNVAGGVALMVDAGRGQSPAITSYADVRVVKAVLLTSADKTSGWSNGQALSSGVIRTTQALDLAVGAGRMNLAQALPYYADPSATRDLPGTAITSPAAVQPRGYDFAAVSRLGQNDYVLPDTPGGVGRLAVTLTWLANRGISSFALTTPNQNGSDFSEHALANLNLQVYRLAANGSFSTLVAESVSDYNNTEHLFLTDLSGGRYGLRVTYPNDVWNFDPVNLTGETYGLAWNLTPVPEPGVVFAVAVVVLAASGAVRRLRFSPRGGSLTSVRV